MRPKKTRMIRCSSEARCFRPRGVLSAELTSVQLTLDEFEAIRLADGEQCEHEEAARAMQVSRPTFSRILASARIKLADGLVHLKEIRIEGGCCTVKGRKHA